MASLIAFSVALSTAWIVGLVIGSRYQAPGALPSWIPAGWIARYWVFGIQPLQAHVWTLVGVLALLIGVFFKGGLAVVILGVALVIFAPLPLYVCAYIRDEVAHGGKEFIFFNAVSPLTVPRSADASTPANFQQAFYIEDADWDSIPACTNELRDFWRQYEVASGLYVFPVNHETLQAFDSLNLHRFLINPGHTKIIDVLTSALAHGNLSKPFKKSPAQLAQEKAEDLFRAPPPNSTPLAPIVTLEPPSSPIPPFELPDTEEFNLAKPPPELDAFITTPTPSPFEPVTETPPDVPLQPPVSAEEEIRSVEDEIAQLTEQAFGDFSTTPPYLEEEPPETMTSETPVETPLEEHAPLPVVLPLTQTEESIQEAPVPVVVPLPTQEVTPEPELAQAVEAVAQPKVELHRPESEVAPSIPKRVKPSPAEEPSPFDLVQLPPELQDPPEETSTPTKPESTS